MIAFLSYRSSMLLILLLNIFVYIVAAPSTDDHGYGFLRLKNESFEDSTRTILNDTVTQSYYLMNDDTPVDVKDIAREENGNVVLFGLGRITLILADEALDFEVWQSCSGASKVCYKSGLIQSVAEGLCPDLTSDCGFDVSKRAGDPHHLKFNTLSIEVDDGGHLSYAMKYDKVDVKKGQTFSSCNPQYGLNKEVQLYSYAKPTCEISVKRAKITLPPPTVSPSLGAESSDTVESANFFATTWGIVVITLIAVLIILGVIGFFIGKKMNWCKSRKSGPVEEAVQIRPDVVEGKQKAAESQPPKDSKINVKEAPVKKFMAENQKRNVSLKLQRLLKQIIQKPLKNHQSRLQLRILDAKQIQHRNLQNWMMLHHLSSMKMTMMKTKWQHLLVQFLWHLLLHLTSSCSSTFKAAKKDATIANKKI